MVFRASIGPREANESRPTTKMQMNTHTYVRMDGRDVA